MARYVIYDTESKTPVEMKGGRTGTMHGRFLSPEETEAKWKEVWENGYGMACHTEEMGGGNHPLWKEQDWNDFKHTL